MRIFRFSLLMSKGRSVENESIWKEKPPTPSFSFSTKGGQTLSSV